MEADIRDDRTGELLGEGQTRRLWRCNDKGAALLFVRGGILGVEEVLRNSALGTGPNGNAPGTPTCPVHGDLDVDEICAEYERPLPNRRVPRTD